MVKILVPSTVLKSLHWQYNESVPFHLHLFQVGNMLPATKISERNCLYCSENLAFSTLFRTVYGCKITFLLWKKKSHCTEKHYHVCLNIMTSLWLACICWRNPAKGNINSPWHYYLKTTFKEKLLKIGRTSKYFFLCFLPRITKH